MILCENKTIKTFMLYPGLSIKVAETLKTFKMFTLNILFYSGFEVFLLNSDDILRTIYCMSVKCNVHVRMIYKKGHENMPNMLSNPSHLAIHLIAWMK